MWWVLLPLALVFLLYLPCAGGFLVVAFHMLEPHVEQLVEVPPLCCSPTGNKSSEKRRIHFVILTSSHTEKANLLSAFGQFSFSVLSGSSPRFLFFRFLPVLFVRSLGHGLKTCLQFSRIRTCYRGWKHSMSTLDWHDFGTQGWTCVKNLQASNGCVFS